MHFIRIKIMFATVCDSNFLCTCALSVAEIKWLALLSLETQTGKPGYSNLSVSSGLLGLCSKPIDRRHIHVATDSV